MPLTEKTRVEAREIIARYPKSRSALLPMLHLVQSEEGYVTPEGIALCAEELGLTKAQVGAVATFYTMYKRRPVGEHLVSVCTNLSCQILGGEEIYAGLSQHLGVGHDQTTQDGAFTLEHAECLAACDYAPVVTVNYEFFDYATPESALATVQELQAGGSPMPTRGEKLCNFRAMSRQLAGFVDEGGLASSSPGHPTTRKPEDSRGTVSLEGTDLVPENAAEFGVPGGVTESLLSGQAAAATYGGTTPNPDAGATDPEQAGTSQSRTVGTGSDTGAGSGTGTRTLNSPAAAGHDDVSQFSDPDAGFAPEKGNRRDKDST